MAKRQKKKQVANAGEPTTKATFDELGKQNSYFIKDLLSGLKDNKR